MLLLLLLLLSVAFAVGNASPAESVPGGNDLFPGGLEANFVRVIWQQMLKAVNAMHEQRVSFCIS